MAPLAAAARPRAAGSRGALQAAGRRRRRRTIAFGDTHLALEERGERNEVVERAVSAGVTRMIAMGVGLPRSRAAVSLANRFQEVWAGVGHYPLEESAPDVDALRDLAADEMVVAVGEIGLDFEHVGGPDRVV